MSFEQKYFFSCSVMASVPFHLPFTPVNEATRILLHILKIRELLGVRPVGLKLVDLLKNEIFFY